MATLMDAFDMVTTRNGWVELPADYAEGLLSKGAGHKYIKRVPKAGGGYRYFYHVAHGGGVHSADHFVEGASFRYEGGHYHVTSARGDTVTVKHDETGQTVTLTKKQLSEGLRTHHLDALSSHHEKAKKDLAAAKEAGASAKQLAKLEKRAAVGAAPGPKASAPAKAVNLTRTNIHTLAQAVGDGDSFSGNIPSTDIPHLKRAIAAGALEAGAKRGEWKLTDLGRQLVGEYRAEDKKRADARAKATADEQAKKIAEEVKRRQAERSSLTNRQWVAAND